MGESHGGGQETAVVSIAKTRLDSGSTNRAESEFYAKIPEFDPVIKIEFEGTVNERTEDQNLAQGL